MSNEVISMFSVSSVAKNRNLFPLWEKFNSVNLCESVSKKD